MKQIDWYYHRNSCNSCTKAQEFLEQNNLTPVETVNCKKEPIDAGELKERLKKVDRVLVTRGKKILELDPKADAEEILSTAIGRSGNLRAPSMRQGSLLLVGYNDEIYTRLQ
ncbi:MAG: hypothetical protein KC800_16655 [Candidatus Eremiobacteraeota bacterium]|nr:hypothetical protein [Candidatus Eremiobacteraeota bacterium]